MSEDGNNAGIIRGVDSQPDLRTLTRVTESQIKRTGTNPTPQTSKPINFSPPGQHQPLNRRPVQARTILSADAQMETDWRSK